MLPGLQLLHNATQEESLADFKLAIIPDHSHTKEIVAYM